VIGVPLALWVNRELLKKSERSQARAEARRLQVALVVVADALRANVLLLREAAEGHRRQLLTRDPEFDVATWKAVCSQLSERFHHPDLLGRLAYHFARVEAAGTLIRRFSGGEFGRRDRHLVRDEIIRNVKALALEAESLGEEIDQAAAAVDTSTALPRRVFRGGLTYRGVPVRDFDEIDVIRRRGDT
jgi:hypothetical protein